MHTILRDLRHAARQFRRAPGFTLVAVLTLGLGIGASSAIFCLIDGLWLHPMPVPHPSELVRLFSTSEQDPEGAFTYSEYQALAARVTALKSTVAIGRRGMLMPRADGTSTMLLTNVVSSDFFSALGVHTLLGRAYSAQDAAWLRTHPGVVLGYRCWQTQFNGDPNIVGRQITLLRGQNHRTQVDVMGVLGPDFREIDHGQDRDLWLPVESWPVVANNADLTSRQFRWFNLLGRLAPHATVAQANSQAATVAHALESADPAANRGRGARVVSDFAYRMSSAGTSGLVLFAIVAGVVLLATVNLAHLLLARGLLRGPEVALRISLGATRWRVARQLLLENLLLCAMGLAAGLAIAGVVAMMLPRLMVSEPAMLSSLGSGAAFHLDWRVFLFAALLSLVTMLLLALVPLGQVARPQLVPALKSGRANGRTPALRRAAVWLQIGISFALLVSTGSLVRSFLNTRTQSIGLTRNQVLVAFTQDPDAPMRDSLSTQLRALPGVQQVAYAIRSPLMLSEGGIAARVLLPGHPEMRDPVEIKYNAISPGYLSVTGTDIVRGRAMTAEDDGNGPPVVLISQAMARRYWPTSDPIGQAVRLAGFNEGKDVIAHVIGVTEDAPINAIGEIPEPYMYLPFHLSQIGELTFVIATAQNAMTMAQPVRQVLIHANPLLDPMMVSSLPELIRYSAGNYQMMAELVTALGFLGLVLTVVGLYGFLAFRVTQRTREIGIRMALGATRSGTTLLILTDTAKLAAVGLLAGIVLAIAATRAESSLLFGVRPLDALSLSAALLVLLAGMAAAAWLPARRAASVDPIQALRAE